MKVLIIPSWYPINPDDVNGSFFREQALALKSAGCEVSVVAVRMQSLRDLPSIINTSDKLPSYECDEGIPTYRVDCVNWFPGLPLMQAKLWGARGMGLFKQYLESHDLPDIIHVHSLFYAGAIAKKISLKFNIPYVITEHSTFFSRGIVTKAMRSWAAKVSARASRRLAVSSSLSNLLDDQLGGANATWEVLPNIVNFQFFERPLHVTINKLFVFINVCILAEKKRVDLLIKAFAKSFKGNDKIILKIGGDGEQRERLVRLAENEGVSRQVNFLGMLPRRQVVDEVIKADVFVLSSKHETFGVVVAEALALGKPVVATRCGGPESIICEGDGVLVPVDDVDALADAMLEIYQNRYLYCSATIRQSCKERFGEKIVTDKLMAIYKQAVTGSATTRRTFR